MLKACLTILKDFAGKSNIHGLRYFGERRLHWSERLWWLISLTVSLWLCGLMIQSAWMDWNENPIAADYSKEAHISTIPFPTVTICPNIKTMKHKFNISSKFNNKHRQFVNLSDVEIEQTNALAHICTIFPAFVRFQENFTSETIFDTIEWLAPDLESTIQSCKWRQNVINCSEFIYSIVTSEGLCFAFNAINLNEIYNEEMVSGKLKNTRNNRSMSQWSLENGYEGNFNGEEYPMRVSSSGHKNGLELVLSTRTSDYEYLCLGYLNGFLVSLSTPGDLLYKSDSFQIQTSDDMLYVIRPRMVYSPKSLSKYRPDQRECFFDFERKLRFFKSYTKANCIVECIANFTMKECGCVKFSMPRDKDTKICGAAKMVCYKETEIKFRANILKSNKCNCLDACMSISYSGKADRTVKIVRQNRTNGLSETTLNIFFESDYIQTKIGVETCTIGEFLGICGGLLGLFLGVSALSVIELVYYTTLRLFWSIRHSRAETPKEQPEQPEQDSQRDQNSENQRVNWVIDSFRKAQAFFMVLCNGSNIHGLRYFGKRKLHWSERLWWLVFVGASIILCSSMIRKIWIQELENPVAMNMAADAKIETVPFPTVTICPDIKAVKSKLDVTLAIKSFGNLSSIETDRLNALAHICFLLPDSVDYTDNFTSDTVYDIIRDIAPNWNQTALAACVWQERFQSSHRLFVPILTEEGLCFTFNALKWQEIYTDEMATGMMTMNKEVLNSSGWSLDDGYTNQSANGNYPFRAVRSGFAEELRLIFTPPQKDIDYHCNGIDQGFKLILTTPGEMVKPSGEYIRLSVSTHNEIEIRPAVVTASEGVRRYEPSRRKCFYSFDRPLRFFRIYTKTNCEDECLANFTKTECGCVKFSSPRDKHTQICGGARVKCYKLAKWKLFTSKDGRAFSDKCNCLPSCTYVRYEANNYRFTFNTDTKTSVVTISSKQYEVKNMHRKELYTFTSDFLAACGGLLGLFLGVSVLSIFEVIYFLTLRLFWSIR